MDERAPVDETYQMLTQALQPEDRGPLTAERLVAYAVRLIPHAEHCSLTLLPLRGQPQTLGTDDPVPARVDAIQYATGEGPCLDAAEGDDAVCVSDLAADERWPAFSPRCVEETSIRSMLAVRLRMKGEDRAALNLFSSRLDAFAEEDLVSAALLAPFIATSIERDLLHEQTFHLKRALESSRQIGTAIGIVMATSRVTAEEAFGVLTRTSQVLNRKLRDIADEVSRTGEVPGG